MKIMDKIRRWLFPQYLSPSEYKALVEFMNDYNFQQDTRLESIKNI